MSAAPIVGPLAEEPAAAFKDLAAECRATQGVQEPGLKNGEATGSFQIPMYDDKPPNYNYTSLSHLVGKQPGFAIFRRFAALNARMLLFLQAEIAELEVQLMGQESDDAESKDDKRMYYQWVIREMTDAPEGKRQQLDLILKIKKKLKEYNDLLLQHEQLYKLSPPNPHDFGKLREWLDSPDRGRMFLEKPEDAWSEEYEEDLVALSTRKNEGDRFTRWLTDRTVPWIHRNILHRKLKQDESAETVFIYSDKRLSRIAEIFSIVTGSLLPTISIIALYFIVVPFVKLIFVLAFSAVFTSCLAIFTKADRIEIFTASVALASVQVVFIGGFSGPS